MVSDAQCVAECNARYIQSVMHRFHQQVIAACNQYASETQILYRVMPSSRRIKAKYIEALERV